MDVAEIQRVGRGLEALLAEFSDCFGRYDAQAYLEVYVEGQNSDLQRKSAEPIALRAGIVPRSLQVFLGAASWDEQRMIDRVQQIVARDHSHPYAIGLIDGTGSAKKGVHTACVQRQWNGNRGKVDNCLVSVHLGYTVGRFHSLLDGDLFLPESWANDRARRERAGIPDHVVHRSKPQIALAQIRRALRNGIRVGPGGPGRLPAQGSHRSVHARLAHTVPQVMGSLRDGTPSGPPPAAAADNAPTAG